MPSIEHFFWNIGGGGVPKASLALQLLSGWGGVIQPPAGAAWPGGMVPAAGAGMTRANVLCEVNGNNGFFPGVSPTLNNGIAATCAGPMLGATPTWVAVRYRLQRAQRLAQKGYFGTQLIPAPQRFWSTAAGAWAPSPKPSWASYPAELPHFSVAHQAKPRDSAVRGYQKRRELVVYETGPLIMAYYHAISGGYAATVYDLYDILNLLFTRARDAGGRRVIMLMGDLNLDPTSCHYYFNATQIGAMQAPSPALALPAGADRWGILTSGASSHNNGSHLDYAIVAQINPGGAAVQAFTETGTLAPAAFAGVPAPINGAFPSLQFGPANEYRSDHRAIRVQIDY